MTGLPPALPAGWEKIETPEETTVVGDEVQLSADQQAAVDHILNANYRIAFLTGQAGAGKSTVANYLMTKHGISCCATTGKAAVGNGSHWTVDALFGLNRNTWEVDFARAEKNLKNMSDIILVDEGSMVGCKMLNALGEAASVIGCKLVLVGDWAQASPVKDDWIFHSHYFDASHFIRLTKNHRQHDHKFLAALNAVRRGEVTDEVADIFKPRVLSTPTAAPGWVRMYATNRETDRHNLKELDNHCARTAQEPTRLMSSWSDLRPQTVQERWPLKPSETRSKIEDANFANGELIAMGAQVMVTCNSFGRFDEKKNRMHRTYINGDVGRVVDIELFPEGHAVRQAEMRDGDGFISMSRDLQSPSLKRGDFQLPIRSAEIQTVYVQLERNGRVVSIGRHNKTFKDTKGREKFTIRGFPLRLGYAMTIHKSQGTTVDRAWLDMGSILKMPEEGRHGLAYVGMSRTRTLEGLYLSEWTPSAIVCDPAVSHLI